MYDEQELFETDTLNADRMRRFTHAMHSLSMGSGQRLAGVVAPRPLPRSADLLRDVGFGPAQVLPSLGYFSIVTAQRPQA